ncbi:hypothetical protein HMPREF1246_0742 [Acidaminococcus sp. BV3L6]|uniref:Uncharacterized protein n=1 Tax=Acidaminococcus intestini (strain RyC-MR95) TaxID=568816 RepID=G4Q877_ACIIR|nr:hypothetical protein Acin_1182 [Acidaminococcus intestini RyC-MR95]ERL19631.1 hypothetical protein HMPREF1246_0742 [Acidaminococcus sp. BV3L6]
MNKNVQSKLKIFCKIWRDIPGDNAGSSSFFHLSAPIFTLLGKIPSTEQGR